MVVRKYQEEKDKSRKLRGKLRKARRVPEEPISLGGQGIQAHAQLVSMTEVVEVLLLPPVSGVQKPDLVG